MEEKEIYKLLLFNPNTSKNLTAFVELQWKKVERYHQDERIVLRRYYYGFKEMLTDTFIRGGDKEPMGNIYKKYRKYKQETEESIESFIDNYGTINCGFLYIKSSIFEAKEFFEMLRSDNKISDYLEELKDLQKASGKSLVEELIEYEKEYTDEVFLEDEKEMARVFIKKLRETIRK